MLFNYDEEVRITASIVGHVLVVLLCFYFSYQLLTMEMPWIFIDYVNLLIHESGHVLFSPFGEFLHILGGSLFQILFPCSFIVAFFLKQDYFSTCFSLFWVADNIINVSVYMRDAQMMQLPLLGEDGVIHDWNWLLSHTGLLPYTSILGTVFFVFGVLCLIISMLGMISYTIWETQNKKNMSDNYRYNLTKDSK